MNANRQSLDDAREDPIPTVIITEPCARRRTHHQREVAGTFRVEVDDSFAEGLDTHIRMVPEEASVTGAPHKLRGGDGSVGHAIE